mmetsp:Transcript_21269/g.56311  ORF Transcript_21269/g.56311 Transcript_21269/m.56311 type:complete len:217 (+) Transcript_21269:352-1002(+)
MDRERLWERPLELSASTGGGASATSPKRLSASSSSLRRIAASFDSFSLLCASSSSSCLRLFSAPVMPFVALVSFSARRIDHSSVTDVHWEPPPSSLGSCFCALSSFCGLSATSTLGALSSLGSLGSLASGFLRPSAISTCTGCRAGFEGGGGFLSSSSGLLSFSFSSPSGSSSSTPPSKPSKSAPPVLRNVSRAVIGHSFEFRYRCCLSEKKFRPS